jgi:predicted 3-demethylubiquinone-9 3-methyltransferase (glyoxalase superfamily)
MIPRAAASRKGMPTITPCLWFDEAAEEAAHHYVSIFPNSRVTAVSHYGEAGPKQAGTVMVVAFELDGQGYQALNGGPEYAFTPAISLSIDCETQEDVDHYWTRLGEGGEEGPCGWLTDRFGVAWQVVPRRLQELLADADPRTAKRVMERMFTMRKLDIAALEDAAAVPA